MVKKERLFTKREWIHMAIVVVIMIMSIFAGMSVYMFFVYGYIYLFPDYGFLTIVNIGGIVIMFYVTMKIYRFFLHLYRQYRELFRFDSAVKKRFNHVVKTKPFEVKEMKIKTPDKDWIKEKKS